jgi:hypothetical protein
MYSVLDAIISSNEQLGQRAEEFAQLLVEHDKTLDELLERIGKTVPEIRHELDTRMVEAIPDLVKEACTQYNQNLESRTLGALSDAQIKSDAALAESQTKLEAVRAEIVALAQTQFTEAEKQIGLTAEQIESRILGTLTEAAQERITKLERGLVIEIQHAVNAAIPKQELAAAPTLIDSYRGQWKEGMVAQRGDLFSYYGSTYLALEDTNDTPGRKNVGRDGAKWAVIAARGAGGGGGGGGGDSLPSQAGNAGKFLKTDGTTPSWEAIPGGGDMLGANNLTDVASTTAAFANIKQAATTTASGVVTFATSGESAALKAVQANDARLSDSRTPTAHASTHQTGGSDPIDFPVDSVFGAINTITQVDYLALNVSSTVAVTTAKIVWNAIETTGELGFNSSVSTLLGMDVHAQVYNQSGSPFTKGQVVRADGTSGTRLNAALALGTSDANSAQTLGLVAQTIGNNASGVIITQGLLRAIDTNSYNAGDTLWLSATTPGAMVNVRPVAPNHGVRVGYVVKKAGASDGIIFVDVQNGLELEELHDVAITAVANNDIISYNASTTVWRNRQLFDSTAPADLGSSATAGISITAARVDHVHARPTLDQLDISGAAQGDILYRSATSWSRLPAATAGYILQTNGAAANPGWVQNTGGSGAPTDAEYLVASANGTLSAERVIQNSTSISVNLATGGQFALERAALTGDVTASQNSNSTTIASDAVSNAKLANMNASTIKARITGSTGDPEDATLTEVLDLVGSVTYGDILYRDSTSWARLPAGASGNYLKTLGAGAAPTWATVSGGGTSAQVDTYTSTGTVITWSKPSGAKVVQIIAYGGGGGGGGGGASVTGNFRTGGGGGGGGACNKLVYEASVLPSSLYVVVGAAGGGGASDVAGTAGGNSTVATNNTNPPTNGILAMGGGGGGGSRGGLLTQVGGGGGGGTNGVGATGSNSASVSGGLPAVAFSNAAIGGQGGGGGYSNTAIGGRAEWGGGGGGATRQESDAFNSPGGGSLYGGGGGGCGRGLNAAGSSAGGTGGGPSGLYVSSSQLPGGAVAAGATAGTAGTAAGTTYTAGGGGGGGGSNNAGTAYAGGAGGFPSGGGGGGGASGVVSSGGTGGAGAAGTVVIITYF